MKEKLKPSTWMPLYVGDYMRDTGHLTIAEHGAYLMLLMHAWTHDGELPAAGPRLSIIAKMDAAHWKKSGPVLLAFFQEIGDTLRHKRLDRELSKAKSNSEKRRIAGRASSGAKAIARADNEPGDETPTDGSTNGQQNVNTCSTDGSTNGQQNVNTCSTDGSTNGQQKCVPSPSPSERRKEVRKRKMASLNRDVSTLASGPGAIGAPSDRISDQPKSARSGPPPREILDWAIATWNRVCGGKLSPVVKITDARRAAFLKRWREDFHEDAQAWEQFCARVAASQFLTNSERKNRADWKANFDFVIEPRNLARIVEGQWDTPPPAKPRGKFDWLDDPPDLADTDPPPEFDLEMTPDADGTYRPH